jgi:hypothetical protein
LGKDEHAQESKDTAWPRIGPHRTDVNRVRQITKPFDLGSD